jgi:hypothetical protein
MDKVRLHRRDTDHCQEGQVNGQGKAAPERSGSSWLRQGWMKIDPDYCEEGQVNGQG